MNIALLVGLGLLANIKVLAQKKANVTGVLGAVAFNNIIFMFTALSFVAFLRIRLSLTTLILSLLFGAATVLYQLLFILAINKGPVSLSVLIANFSVLPVTVYGLICGEAAKPTRIIGLMLVLISLVLNTRRENKKAGALWLLTATGAALCSGLGMIILRIHQNTSFAAERNVFLFFGYLFATVLSVLVLLFKNKSSLKINKKFVTLGAAGGIVLAGYQFVLIWLSGILDATFMYPLISGFTLLFNFIFSAVFFKEKLTPKQITAAVLGAAAILILQF